MKKEAFTIGVLLLLVLSLLTGCGGNKGQQVICSVCNGTGQVKYFYGDKDDEYNWGPCTSCDEKGYIMTVPSGDSNGGKNQICSSCERYSFRISDLPIPRSAPQCGGRVRAASG